MRVGRVKRGEKMEETKNYQVLWNGPGPPVLLTLDHLNVERSRGGACAKKEPGPKDNTQEGSASNV